MANTYQRNEQNSIYRNGCAKEVSKKLKYRQNKKCTYKGKSTYFISKTQVHDTNFPIIQHTRSSFCKTSESGICHDNPAYDSNNSLPSCVHPIFIGIWLPLFLCLGEIFHLALRLSHQGSLESDLSDCADNGIWHSCYSQAC